MKQCLSIFVVILVQVVVSAAEGFTNASDITSECLNEAPEPVYMEINCTEKELDQFNSLSREMLVCAMMTGDTYGVQLDFVYPCGVPDSDSVTITVNAEILLTDDGKAVDVMPFDNYKQLTFTETDGDVSEETKVNECETFDPASVSKFKQGHQYQLSYTMPQIDKDTVSLVTNLPALIYVELEGKNDNQDDIFCTVVDVRIKDSTV